MHHQGTSQIDMGKLDSVHMESLEGWGGTCRLYRVKLQAAGGEEPESVPGAQVEPFLAELEVQVGVVVAEQQDESVDISVPHQWSEANALAEEGKVEPVLEV